MHNSSSEAAGSGLVTGRVAFCVQYNGNAYHGWQSQKSGLPTVQSVVESAISSVANHPVEIVCAGRTDKSVHSSFQVIHFDTKESQNEARNLNHTHHHLTKGYH